MKVPELSSMGAPKNERMKVVATHVVGLPLYSHTAHHSHSKKRAGGGALSCFTVTGNHKIWETPNIVQWIASLWQQVIKPKGQ